MLEEDFTYVVPFLKGLSDSQLFFSILLLLPLN